MNIYVIVENGVVVNRTRAEQPLSSNWIANDVAQIGWLYQVGGFFEPPPEPVFVPTAMTARQARLALLSVDLLDDAEAAVGAMSRAAQIEWEYASEILRDNALIIEAQALLGLSDEQMDDLFRKGAAL